MKHCSGCGITLQSKNPEQPGFIPASSLEKQGVLCKRCFRIRHYGEIQPVQQSEGDFVRILKDLKKKKCMVVYVMDLFDLEGSMIPKSPEMLQDKPVLIVGNKIDLFPRSVKRERIKKYLRAFARQNGIEPMDVLVCSAENGINMEGVVDTIERLRNGRDVFVIGTTNVGKSTFMNRILPVLGEGAEMTITTSAYPGTTLDAISIPLQDGKEMVDTPGFLRTDFLSEWLSPEECKVVTPRQTINPKVYQLEEKQTLFFGGLIRMDFKEGDKQSFGIYVSNHLYLHRTKLEKADQFQASQRGNLLVPPQDPTVLPPWKEHVFHFPGDKKEDIVISGLGWIVCGNEKATVSVWAPEGIHVGRRPALV